MLKKCGTTCKTVKRQWGRIHLVDRCLILFMSLLLLQSAYNMIVHHDEKGPASDIDIIVRTASASIFGYFLSANFIKNESVAIEKSNSEDQVESQEIESVPAEHTEKTEAGRFQIMVAAGIGLFCLAILIFLRDIPGWEKGAEISATAAATVAQFRDFVSGCVGFLIGCPTGRR